MPVTDTYLEDGITALRAGDKAVARACFVELIRDRPDDERAWLWLALSVESPARARYCLERVLTLNPANAQARRALRRVASFAEERDPQRAAPRCPRVLVVDDSATVRRVVTISLLREQMAVDEAADGMEALERIAARPPDLVLLDISMPRMDGYQVCRILRASPATREIPVVMLSGHDGLFDRVKGRHAGATDYLVKPFQPAALLQAIQRHLGLATRSEVS